MKIAVNKPMDKVAMDYAFRFGEVTVLDAVTHEEIMEKFRKNPADALILRYTGIDEKMLKELKNCGCKVVAKHGTGVDNVDLDVATNLEIPVVYAFGANSRSVAEFTLSLILASYKKITICNKLSHFGDNSYRVKSYTCNNFLDKSVYVLGFGSIGRQVSKMCLALGMKVYAYDKYLDRKRIEDEGVIWCESIEEGLPLADIVTMHMPLTDETAKCANAEFYARMKKSAFFINTARGGLVDEDALCDSLESSYLGGAALDACSIDDGIVNERLTRLDNVILTAHVAAMSTESLAQVGKLCVDGIVSVLQNKKWKVTANPKVYDVLGW